MFLKISQISGYCEICEIFKNIFYGGLPVAVSGLKEVKIHIEYDSITLWNDSQVYKRLFFYVVSVEESTSFSRIVTFFKRF